MATLKGDTHQNVLVGTDDDDRIFGLAGNDALFGRTGNDTLNGGLGIDQLLGGLGNDRYIVENPDDTVTESLHEGYDRVIAAISFRLPANLEALDLRGLSAITGRGNVLDNTLLGNDADNRLFGQNGDDLLRGRGGDDLLYGGRGNDWLDGGAGLDELSGGVGDDVYRIERTGDRVIERGKEGTDTVRSSASFTLPDNVESLVLTSPAAVRGIGNGSSNGLLGSKADNRLTGLGGDDVLLGRDGDDLLNGGAGNDRLNGGTGVNVMVGGPGDDVCLIDNANDTFTERFDEGFDKVISSVTIVLFPGVEALDLVGSSAIDGSGNNLSNRITGNAGNNRLLGGEGEDFLRGRGGDDFLDGGLRNDFLNGGPGADVMSGGKGSDTYIVDDPGDTVIEDVLVPPGRDTVKSSVSFILGPNVEYLILTGTGAINGTGNGGNNRIQGNSAANILTGGGANDRPGSIEWLVGGGGDDTLQDSHGSMHGGFGNDVLKRDALLGSWTNDGGPGRNDILELTAPGQALNLPGVPVSGIETIRFGGSSNRIHINMQSLLDEQAAGNVLTLDNSADDLLLLPEEWNDEGIRNGYHVLSRDGATLRFNPETLVLSPYTIHDTVTADSVGDFFTPEAEAVFIDFGGQRYGNGTVLDLSGFGAEDFLAIAIRDGALSWQSARYGTNKKYFISQTDTASGSSMRATDWVSWNTVSGTARLQSAWNDRFDSWSGEVRIIGLPTDLPDSQFVFI